MMIWNVRGAASKDFLLTLKELIKRYNLGVVSLLETKISVKMLIRFVTRLDYLGTKGNFAKRLDALVEEFGSFGIMILFSILSSPVTNILL